MVASFLQVSPAALAWISLMRLMFLDLSPLMNFSWLFSHLSWNLSKKELKVNRYALKLVCMIFFSPFGLHFFATVVKLKKVSNGHAD